MSDVEHPTASSSLDCTMENFHFSISLVGKLVFLLLFYFYSCIVFFHEDIL